MKPSSSNEPLGVPSEALGHGDVQKSRDLASTGHMVILRPLESSNSLHLNKFGHFFIHYVNYWGWNGSF